MNVSTVGTTRPVSPYAQIVRNAAAVKGSTQSAASAPVDADGDRDGSTAGSGRIDVKA